MTRPIPYTQGGMAVARRRPAGIARRQTPHPSPHDKPAFAQSGAATPDMGQLASDPPRSAGGRRSELLALRLERLVRGPDALAGTGADRSQHTRLTR